MILLKFPFSVNENNNDVSLRSIQYFKLILLSRQS